MSSAHDGQADLFYQNGGSSPGRGVSVHVPVVRRSAMAVAAAVGLAIGSSWMATQSASAQSVLITEFLASNSANLADEDGEFSDWIELANVSNASINMDGWYLSDSAGNKTKWRLPALILAPGQHKLVWASNKNRVNPAGPLHTNFRLGAEGEYLGLTRPDGTTVEHQYAPTFPPQTADVSYGISTDASVSSMVAVGAACRATVPTSSALGTSWTGRLYAVPGTWLTGATGVGYETGTGYESLISLNVQSAMYNRGTSCYIRVPFALGSVPTFDRLTLRMKYDDGFVAYVNGVRVAASNAPASPIWSSAATQGNPDERAVLFEDFDVTAAAASALVSGTNVLAIHGLNFSSTNQDFLMVPELVASRTGTYQPGVFRSFVVPTPGMLNVLSSADRAPQITEQAFAPALPGDADAITVTAKVTAAVAPISAVTLRYRVDYGAEVAIPMLDDGTRGDGVAGDGIYGAVIPASASLPGQMVRWSITSADTASNIGRMPQFISSTQSPEYFGTMVAVPTVVSQLPTLWWWVQNTGAAATDTGTRCSLYFRGRFYDNVFVRLRGQGSAGWPKPHYKLDFNPSDHFYYSEDVPPVEEFNLQSTYSDKAYLRQLLSWETYRNAGAAGCESFMLRVQQNGAFHSVAVFVEQPDEDMLSRNGIDNTGALYKMYNECNDGNGGFEKKTRQSENNSDLVNLVSGVQLPTGSALTNYMFDNIDIPATISYIAATTIIHDNDHVAKNYYVYRDTEGSGEWTMLPWDKDLTFGRNFGAGGGVLSDGIWANNDGMSHPLFGNAQYTKIDGPWNRFIDAMHREPTIRAMYLRRLRTLMDTLLQPASTPLPARRFESRIDSLFAQCLPDVLLDRARWGNPYGENQDFATAVNILKNDYLVRRRSHLFQTHSAGPGGIIPVAQSAAPFVAFGAVERAPVSGNKDEEFIELVNPTAEAVDLSGWKLRGDISHTFRPGTVLPAGKSLFVSPNVVAFRARVASPRGGEARFVQGNFNGHLSVPPTEIRLENVAGVIIGTLAACPADITGDGVADGADFIAFINSFSSGDPAIDPKADVAGAGPANDQPDGIIDGADFIAFINAFSAGC